MRQPCVQCGQPLELSEANTTSLEAPPVVTEPRMAVSSADLKAFDGPQQCSRCGTKFRGEWDRYQGESGLLCHRCANFAGINGNSSNASKPQPLTSASHASEQPRVLYPPPEPEPHEPSFSEKFEAFRETQQFRIGLYVAAFGVIGLALFYSFFPPATPSSNHHAPNEATGSQANEHIGLGLMGDPHDLSQGQHKAIALTVRLTQFILLCLLYSITLWLILRDYGMPGSTWWAGAINIGIVSVVLAGPVLLAHMAALILFFAPLIAFVLGLYIVHEVYDLGFGRLMTFVFFSILVSYLMKPAGQIIYGVMGALLF